MLASAFCQYFAPLASSSQVSAAFAEILTKEITAVSVVETIWEHIDRSNNVLKLELFIFVTSDARSET